MVFNCCSILSLSDFSLSFSSRSSFFSACVRIKRRTWLEERFTNLHKMKIKLNSRYNFSAHGFLTEDLQDVQKAKIKNSENYRIRICYRITIRNTQHGGVKYVAWVFSFTKGSLQSWVTTPSYYNLKHHFSVALLSWWWKEGCCRNSK